MSKEYIQPKGLIKPTTFSQVVKAGSTIYISGQVAQDISGNVVGAGNFFEQSTKVFENLKNALASVSCSFKDLVKLNIYITDPRYREILREVRSIYLYEPLPAVTLVVVSSLADPGYLIEIEAIAVIE